MSRKRIDERLNAVEEMLVNGVSTSIVAHRVSDLLAKVDGLFVTAAHGGRTDETATESQVRKIREMGPHERRARIHELIIRAIRAEPEFAATAREALGSMSH